MKRGIPKAVYVHIPFCHRICPYCDFNKYVYKGQPVQRYLEALKKEMQHTVEQTPPREIRSIFVGGGTPTSLSVEQMIFLLDSINDYFRPQVEDLEFTVEANPENMSKPLLEEMKKRGVNRLSYGVQSFDEKLLKSLGRLHRNEEVHQSIAWAKEVGIVNISVDLMFGLPNQSLEMWLKTIDTALTLGVSHISAYGLKVEEGTFFHRLYEKDKLPLPEEETEARMYELLMEKMLAAGYQQYEISNFALPSFESRHNLTYWRNEAYYGVGAGAHGYVGEQRHENMGPVEAYINLVDQQGLPYEQLHQVTSKEEIENEMIMGLRLAEGISSNKFIEKYSIALENIYDIPLKNLLNQGLLEKEKDIYRLTRKGKLLGNEVFASFLS